MNSSQLKTERKQRGWSQAKIAEALGVNLSTVRRWEQGEAMPHPYYRKKLTALFGKTTQELGLLSNSEENDVVEDTSLLATQFAKTHQSLLLDPAIPQTLGSANSLQGHDSLLMEAKQRLLAGGNLTLTALGGLPGIGKTSLAVALATDPEIQAYFHDGILWAGLGPRPKLLVQFAHWGNLLGVVPSQVNSIESRMAWGQALRTAIGTRQMLLVIDDAWTVEDALALQVGGPACAYLMTTRLSQIALTLNQEETIVIRQLKEADGLALLARFIPQLIQQDPQGARALVWALGGLPLALTLIGKYLASHSQAFTQQSQPLQAVLELLHDTEKRLSEKVLTISGQHSLSLMQAMPPYLHAAIALCDQQLSSQAHTTLCALAFFPPKPHSFSEEAALAASQQPEEILDTLRETGLLETYGPGRYTLHQTVANYARVQNDLLTTQQASSLVGDSQPEQDTRLARHPFSVQFLQYARPRHANKVPTFRASNHYSQHPLFIGAIILLTALLIVDAFPAFTKLPFFRENEKQVAPSHVVDTYGPPSYTLTIQNTDPSLNDTTQHLQNAFKAVYAQLVNRFALHPASMTKYAVLLTFSSDLPFAADASGMTITINSDWIKQHPDAIGVLTYELTSIVEQYPSGAPAWFSSGIANYARYVYGPADDDDWSLPNGVQPQDNYEQGYGVAARFLLWLEQHTRLDIVDQLNHALQTQQSFSAVFHYLTNYTVDDLWNQYKKQPDITLAPQQLYKTVTSRKPFYQSSFHLQPSDQVNYVYAPKLYLSDFAMQADITTISGSAGGGFFFRTQSDTNYWGAFVLPNGNYQLDYQNTPLTTKYSPAIKQGFNQTNRLTIVTQKHTIYLYINSQFITQVDDKNLTAGTVGVMTSNYSIPTNVQFKKVQVF